ncbi:MAG TPA: RagB/SusD family nutrient uptake outer membrane protein, partial [Longimicrobiales bacterium]|nr:RagB/SusD family nutrient uptake outer membrane protein [Longimicrobiales bacterium]
LATQKTAAIAGRASVRVQLGDWAGAVADAAQVPTTFVFYARYEPDEQSFNNRIYFAGADQPYRAVTTWNTPYEAYYTATKDPRVPWNDTGLKGDASVGVVGARVNFYRQAKFPERGSDIRLSSGYEMRLIEAENKLRNSDMAGAMAILNARRTDLGLAPWAPADMTEAWANFKRERGIELWLEGRRLGDLYRWKAGNTPGALGALETAGNPASYLAANQDLCYPIPKSEREANPNISVTP